MMYDKNGNILNLHRSGDLDTDAFTIQIDDLEYIYDANKKNQLMEVIDLEAHPEGFKDGTNTTDDYAYDANGNMTQDLNKEIESITYNHLNLPTEIIFTGTDKKITYLYDATGRKVQKTVQDDTDITETDYLTGFQYMKEPTDIVKLKFFPHAEGYVNATRTHSGYRYNYVYNYLDHLGNIRVSWTYDEEIEGLKILEEHHYYPFGLKHQKYNAEKWEFVGDDTFPSGVAIEFTTGRLPYQYKYQGQELQDELGLGWYAFKWRNYDPAIARFMSIDPLTETYEDYTPYQFASNQPVHAQEVEGLENSQDLNKKNLRETRTVVNDNIPKARATVRLQTASASSAAKQKEYSGPMLSQDKMTTAARTQRDSSIRAEMAQTEVARKTLDNHENLGSPYTAKTVMEGVAHGIPMVMIPGGGATATATTAEKGFAVIGEGMEAVNATKSAMLNVGFENVETFQATKGAMAEWAQLTSGGAQISDDVVKGTQLFKENQAWIQGMKDSGRTIIDIGRDGRKVQSTFYNMEKQVINAK